MGRAFGPAVASRYVATGLLSSFAFLEGCTTTPSIEVETRQVPVSEIVERVKCEIWQATKDRLADPYFAFLKKWDATVDLTLMVNEQSGISPGVSLIQPLNNVVLANKGTFSQSFSLGLGGGVTGQANLSDTVSFSLSLKELAYVDPGLNKYQNFNQFYHLCEPLQQNDLIGYLRFKEWIDQALSPAHDPENGFTYLTPGVHPAVQKGGGLSTSAKIAAAKDATFKTLDNELGTLKRIEVVPADPALQRKTDTINDIKGKITTENLMDNPEVLDNLITQHEKDTDRFFFNTLSDLKNKVEAAKKPPPKPKQTKKPPINDPIDTISHQIQFIVTWNANATPSWTLVNVKGPAPASGSFLSAQRQTTHQLLITMGPVKADVTSVRQFQQFSAALRSSPITVLPAQ